MTKKKLCDLLNYVLRIVFRLILVLIVAYFFIIIKQYIPLLALLRTPIIAGLILFLFPIISVTQIYQLLGNLFVMRGGGQLIAVLGFSIGTAAIIVSSFNFIIINAHTRLGIEPLSTDLYNIVSNINILNNLDISTVSWVIFFVFPVIILILPIWIITLYLTIKDFKYKKYLEKPDKSNLTNPSQVNNNYSILGTSLIVFGTVILEVLIKHQIINHLCHLSNVGYKSEFRECFDKLDIDIASEFFSLFIVGGIVYLLGFLAFSPKKLKAETKKFKKLPERYSAPALFYLLLMLWVLTGCFSLLSFWVAPLGIPISLIVIALSGCLYWIFSIDNYFELKPKKKIDPACPICCDQKDNFIEIIKRRLAKSNSKTLVVIATSGGGIQSSGWTAQVLCGLQKQLKKSFTQSIGLISAVSGGSVGTMFFLDQFDENQNCPPNKSLKNIVKNATEDWLDAVGWGIAYPDMMRFFGLPPLLDRYIDRGYSLEWDWQKRLKHPDITLADWRKKVKNGIIPIPVFNGTLLEDGRRFLISPVKFLDTTNREMKARDFQTLYPGYDLDVTTAARLSASFPYVSPLPRPYVSPSANKKLNVYHVADGGYFDNFGTFTAIEWLDKNIEYLMNNSIVERVIFIQINHFPSPPRKRYQKEISGWFAQLIGSFMTLFNVKNSTQTARNNKEIELIKDKIELIQLKMEVCKLNSEEQLNQSQNITLNNPNEKKFHSFTIAFTGENAPLSWCLTNRQIYDLKQEWDRYLNSNVKSDVQELIHLWNEIQSASSS